MLHHTFAGFTWVLRFFLLLLVVLLASCGGDSDGPASGSGDQNIPDGINNGQQESGPDTQHVSAQGGYLIKFVGNIDSRKPVPGVTVSLYETGGQDPKKTIVTDDTGIADFGDVSTSSTTIIYGFEVEENKTVVLQALVDYSPGYLEIPTQTDPLEVTATVDVAFTGDHGGAITSLLHPVVVSGITSLNGQSASFTDVQVLKPGVQLDGKVSFLAQALGLGTEPYKRYGYLLDQDLEDGKSYAGTFDHSYEPFSWKSDRLLERGVGQSLYRGGVLFASLGGDAPVSGYEGQQKAISQFPADIHVYSASSTTTDSGFTESRFSQIMTEAFPATELEFVFADFYLTDVVAEESPGSYSISWLKNGSDPATVFNFADSRVTFSGDTQSEVSKNYNVEFSAPPETGQFTFPRLRGELATWFAEFQLISHRDRWAILTFYPYKPNFSDFTRASRGCYESLFRDAECIRAGFFKDS